MGEWRKIERDMECRNLVDHCFEASNVLKEQEQRLEILYESPGRNFKEILLFIYMLQCLNERSISFVFIWCFQSEKEKWLHIIIIEQWKVFILQLLFGVLYA